MHIFSAVKMTVSPLPSFISLINWREWRRLVFKDGLFIHANIGFGSPVTHIYGYVRLLKRLNLLQFPGPFALIKATGRFAQRGYGRSKHLGWQGTGEFKLMVTTVDFFHT
jgi:hypothetical protein